MRWSLCSLKSRHRSLLRPSQVCGPNASPPPQASNFDQKKAYLPLQCWVGCVNRKCAVPICQQVLCRQARRRYVRHLLVSPEAFSCLRRPWCTWGCRAEAAGSAIPAGVGADIIPCCHRATQRRILVSLPAPGCSNGGVAGVAANSQHRSSEKPFPLHRSLAGWFAAIALTLNGRKAVMAADCKGFRLFS